MPDDYRDGLLGPPRPALDLDAIRARRAAISPGRWYEDADETGQDYIYLGTDGGRLYVGDMSETTRQEHADAAFIAAAPADIDALLAEVRRLHAVQQERAQLYRAIFANFADALQDIARGLDPATGWLSSEVRAHLAAPLHRALAEQDALQAQLDALDAPAWRNAMPEDGPMWA